MIRKLAVSVVAVCMCLTPTLSFAQSTVKTESGQVKGTEADGVLAFKGIPYAAPPVGDLRWRAPQPGKPWKGVREASAYGHDCMQLPFPSDAAPLGTAPSEDCLVMNVWRPATSEKKLPVMVWIYGGGFVNGGSSPDVYNGTHFAKDGVMLVSFNYRVGRFGFFAHPALTKEAGDTPTGNFGYMDQIAALRWVQRNIAAFGGNPGNVTIFGESAGGFSVHMLLTSPLTNGLFQKAIVESGGGRLLLQGDLDLAGAEKIGQAFARAKGITEDGPDALKKMRALPADSVVDGLNIASMLNPATGATYSGTMKDGKIVVESFEDAYKAGHEKHVPIIIGANSFDLGFVQAQSKEQLFAEFGPSAKQAEAAYDPSGQAPLQLIGQVVAADGMMVEPARFVAEEFTRIGLHAWEYRFSYVPDAMVASLPEVMTRNLPDHKLPGLPHAAEIPFVFDTVKEKYGAAAVPEDESIARYANRAWAQFAKTGDPNGGGLPTWPAYTPAKDTIMDFSGKGPVATADPWKPRLDLTQQKAEQSSAPGKSR